MALSNAERQARFQQRLRERAAASQGVTPEMVREAAAVIYRQVCHQQDDTPDWPAFLASCHKRRGGSTWSDFVPNDVRPNAYDWIEDAAERELVERVAAVSNAVMCPPA